MTREKKKRKKTCTSASSYSPLPKGWSKSTKQIGPQMHGDLLVAIPCSANAPQLVTCRRKMHQRPMQEHLSNLNNGRHLSV